jgi:hypothetical protein
VVNQVGGASAGAQKQLGDMMEKYLVSMNLPSGPRWSAWPSGCSRSKAS